MSPVTLDTAGVNVFKSLEWTSCPRVNCFLFLDLFLVRLFVFVRGGSSCVRRLEDIK
jgi:hypothetical protein